ncbi:MAG: tetratricopeptide repeat protein, partial [Planctomycetaceae bacterium]|nr:tetratricopeptide repeat protein [Planctomycetaceae bacterium]
VAWAWLFGSKHAAQQCAREFSTTSLLERILDGLEVSGQKNASHHAVCQSLARLALGRVDLPKTVSDGLLTGLSPLESDIVRGCFCEEWPNTISLHPIVAHEVVTRARDRKREGTNSVWRLEPADRTRVHNRLYDLANQTPAGTSFRADLESLHHGVLSNQIHDIAAEPRLHFVEQLHEIGRSLSYVFRSHQQAADVFRLALSLDADNAYSHHYLAFNLDWNAEAADEVETHYKKAIELQPEHPWWWSRWISYLATRGRFKAAGNQWREALDALSVTEDATPNWVYMSLHRWVARWMLHWSNLDLAENVLRSIPSSLEDDASISRLNDLLVAMRYAEKDRAVFPLSVPASEWWTPRPHTDLPNEADNLRLSHWYPARVQHIDDNGVVFLLYAEPPTCSDVEPVFRERELSRDEVQVAAHEFDSQTLHEGSFIELGYYGDNAMLKIGMHAEGTLNDPDLIPLVPPPDRWYDRAVAASWDDIGGEQ